MNEAGTHNTWGADDDGPIVRPYVMTRGRTRASNAELDLVTMVVATRRPDYGLTHDQLLALHCCRQPTSVAEVAAMLEVPLLAAKVLLSDLLSSGYVAANNPAIATATPDLQLLQKVLDGIRRL